MRSLRVALALAAVVALASKSSRAGGMPAATHRLSEAIQIEPGPCLEARPMLDRIGLWLGREELDARLEGTIRIDRGDLVFALLREGKPLGERRFTRRPSDSCAQWTTAVSLAIAVALDSTLLQSLGVWPPVAPPAVVPPLPGAPPPPAPEKSPTPSASIGLDLLTGSVPDGTTAGGRLRLEVPLGAAFDLGIAGFGSSTVLGDLKLPPGHIGLTLWGGGG